MRIGADGRIQSRDESARIQVDPAEAEETAEAAGIVEEARRRAEELLREAMAQAAAIQHDAYREGREEGHAEGMAEARAELAEALALVQAAASEAKAMRDRLLWNTEREVVELVLDVARTVIGEQVAIEPALVLDTVERALTRAGSQNVVRLRVHPDERSIVHASIAERHGDEAPFQVLGDRAVNVGGCIVDTAAGEVDARLDVQLDEVARVLRSALPDSPPASLPASLMGAAGGD